MSFAERGPTAARAVLAILAVAVVTAGAWRAYQSAPGLDYYQYWVVGWAARSGAVENVYDPAAGEKLARDFRWLAARGSAGAQQRAAARRRPVIEVFSTPFLYAVFGLAASGDYAFDYAVFQGVSQAAGIAAVLLFCHLLGYGVPAASLALCVLGLAFEPFYSDVVVGNVNRLLLLALALAAALQAAPAVAGPIGTPLLHGRTPRDAATGFVLGLAVLFKPLTAFAAGALVVWQLLARRSRAIGAELAGAVAACAVAVATSALAFGSLDPWSHWWTALVELMTRFEVPVRLGNFSPVQIALEATGVDLALPVATGVAAGLGLCLWSGRARSAEPQDGTGARAALVLGVAASATLLFSRLAWLHYFVMTVPLILYLLGPAAREARRRHAAIAPGSPRSANGSWWMRAAGAPSSWPMRGAAAIAALLISLQPFRLARGTDPTDAALCAACGCAVLVALGARELARQPRAPSAPGAARSRPEPPKPERTDPT